MAAPVVHHVDGDDGTLTITITRGRRLAAMDRWTSASDPYCKVYYGETLVGTTSVVKSSTNPVWSDGTFECASHGAPSHKPHKAVVLELWDEDHGSADDAMGRVVVDVGHLGGLQGAMAKPKAWYDVESPTQLGKKKDWGQVEVAVAYAEGEGGGLFEGHGYMDRDVRSLRLLGTLFEECDTKRTGELDRDEFRRLYAKLKAEWKSTSELDMSSQTSKFSISVKSKSFWLIFGRLFPSRRTLEIWIKILRKLIRIWRR